MEKIKEILHPHRHDDNVAANNTTGNVGSHNQDQTQGNDGALNRLGGGENITGTDRAPATAGTRFGDNSIAQDPEGNMHHLGGHHHDQQAGVGGIGNTGEVQGEHRDQHIGRDAAVAGAVGAGGYEAEKHHREHGQHQGGVEGNIGAFGNDGGVQGDSGRHDHHLGRDAAGAGAIGVGGYEAERHHREHEGQHHGGVGGNIGGFGNGGGVGNTGGIQGEGRHHDNGHHYGRDAAVAGGVGAAGYEAEKHHRELEGQHGHHGHHNNGAVTDTGAATGAGGAGGAFGSSSSTAPGATGGAVPEALVQAEAGNNFPGTNPHPAHSALGNVDMTGQAGTVFPGQE